MIFDPWEQRGEEVGLHVPIGESAANNLSDLIQVSLELSEPYSVGVDGEGVDGVGVDGVVGGKYTGGKSLARIS